ncbi:hypothetical protein GCM10011492_11370 [Flexivirga endophytica]|uniref:Uncharacterized protein n=1 Tax=Flexivirga endophytica TaxID=1849103 RepID=A0A916WRC2_9MICO|nr:hypothetical protein GCM10011492_11370 [Flexivirga endophytica]GHB57160.1 hypothetical protein GCM10008112_27910 [Flexivirga endophytica]
MCVRPEYRARKETAANWAVDIVVGWNGNTIVVVDMRSPRGDQGTQPVAAGRQGGAGHSDTTDATSLRPATAPTNLAAV